MKLVSNFPLFSFRAKYAGVLLMFLGAIGLYLFNYQYYKPEWLQLNVFTVYSSFISTKIFTFIKNNQGDEISTLLYFLGSFLIIASAEKNEKPLLQTIRIKSLAWAAILSMVVFLIEYLLLHGMAVVYAALLIPYMIPLFYFAGFYILNKKQLMHG